jgi:hypothetical protein
MTNSVRGLKCDKCGMRFAGSPDSTTVMWDPEDEQVQRPQVVFLHKTCVTEELDRAYLYCGGGAWFSTQDQVASLGRILARRSLLYSDGKAVERYRTFCKTVLPRKTP